MTRKPPPLPDFDLLIADAPSLDDVLDAVRRPSLVPKLPSSADRVRRHRQRHKEGREVLTWAVPVWLIEDLVEAGFLNQFDRDNKQKIVEALERVHQIMRLDVMRGK